MGRHLEPVRVVVHARDEERPVGLGDLVAKVAQPAAELIDRVLKTDLSRCGGCAERRAALNKLIPDIGKPLSK